MHLTDLDLLLWAASFLTNAILLIVLVVRGRVASLPVFTTLIALNVGRTIALFLIQHFGTRHIYFYTYWYLAIVDVVLQLGVVCEIAKHIFRSRGKWAKDVAPRLLWWCAGSIALAIALTAIPKPLTRLWMQSLMIKGSFFSAALMSELFVVMVLLAARSGMPWKTHVARIAEGFAAYSFISVLLETGNTYFGLATNTRAYDNLSRVRIMIYIFCAVYWSITLWMNSEPARVMTERMRQQLNELNRSAAMDVQRLRSGGDS
jgi:hypothetical protein